MERYGMKQNLNEIQIWSPKKFASVWNGSFTFLTKFWHKFWPFCMNDSEHHEAKRHLLLRKAIFSLNPTHHPSETKVCRQFSRSKQYSPESSERSSCFTESYSYKHNAKVSNNTEQILSKLWWILFILPKSYFVFVCFTDFKLLVCLYFQNANLNSKLLKFQYCRYLAKTV